MKTIGITGVFEELMKNLSSFLRIIQLSERQKIQESYLPTRHLIFQEVDKFCPKISEELVNK